MADVATRLRNFLKAQTTIANIVGQRIYETRPAQHKTDPYIRFRGVSSENADVLNGSVGDAPLNYSIPIECLSRDETVAKTLTAAVRTALHLYRGAFDDATAKGCFVDSESVELDRFPDSSDNGYFIGTLDTRIFL